METVVVKLGVGNTASVMFALERLGAKAVLSDDARVIADAARVILPGVGAAAHAMARMRALGIDRVLRVFARPLLGICLGQQLLHESSEEGGGVEGLGFFAGSVARLPESTRLPSPHMAWSAFYIDRNHALLEGVASGAYAYFVHSYACPIGARTMAVSHYGRPFASIVGDDNVFGCQFHPERSGAVGARILANFASLPC